MHPQTEKELARVLLVELLAYQLASPVQWIDTQTALLSEQGIRRLIEIGPKNTLAAMAKKTLAGQADDSLIGLKHELLAYNSNQKDIRYEVEPSPQADAASTSKSESAAEAASSRAPSTATAEPAPLPVAAPPAPPAAAAVEVPDVLPTVKEIVRAIIASKLQQSFTSLPMDKTIKQLAGGRSMIENEIVGDLSAEIGSLPDRLEDIRLDSLCVQLDSSCPPASAFKKPITGLITRLMSLKMPNGFNATQVRAHLRDRWGLGPGRQNSVVVRAAASQPASRLGSEAEARAFFDNLVKEYAEEVGLDLQAPASGSAGNAASGGGAGTIDPQILAQYEQGKEARRKRKINLLSKLHGIDPTAGHQATRQARELVDALQGKLDGLHAELGGALVEGIQPMWSIHKVRRFDSSWNWAIQDLFDTFYSIISSDKDQTADEVLRLSKLLANRSDDRMVRIARFLFTKEYQSKPERVQSAKDFLGHIIDLANGTQPEPRVIFEAEWTYAPSVEVNGQGQISYRDVPRAEAGPPSSISLEACGPQGWQMSSDLTSAFFAASDKARESGLSFREKTVLITGAGPWSIGADVVKSLLNGGASVIVTTSSYSPATARWYQDMYATNGAHGSELVVVPFNQGSQQDIESLVDYIFDEGDGLGWDLDHVVPLAAISERGREVDGIDSKSELAHRVMLTNLLRLLGAIKKRKEACGYTCRPTQVVLPLSPNHGVFGGDGLYAESKISLETLANKWSSESWADYLSICGAKIGWTRGTGLMAANDKLARGIEDLGLRTFSRMEMAFYLLLLMSRNIAKPNELEPVFADLSGGMAAVPDLKDSMAGIRNDITEEIAIQKALADEEHFENVENNDKAAPDATEDNREANLALDHPELQSYDEVVAAAGVDLQGMVDLDRVVVITGFSEVGPWGNARTRWEMETSGCFSLEGCVEMAWIMGLIKHHDGQLNGKHYIGWVDAKTGKPVRDSDIKAQYEPQILEHTGIRLIEPEMDDGYQPAQKQFLQEVILEDDLPPFQIAKSLATDIQHEHGDKVEIVDLLGADNSDECSVYLKKGATLYVPKAIQSDRRTAGQIPSGWDARKYGVTDDIISQVDRVTLFALISTAEALVHAGLTDPYELYRYMHVSEVGNCIGSSLGGQQSLRGMFKNRFMDKPVQTDVLQETFINTISAWINMLLMSAAGPIRTPVGACATSLESLETGYETIISGKAKMCLVGGFDDLTEQVSFEFANMNVTTNDNQEQAKGRTPQEGSRPTASTRSGFVESQGGGVQVLTSARLALDMGLPVHGIVAWVSTACDGQGRSVPAAGKGILINAREQQTAHPPALLDFNYRRRRMNLQMQHIEASLEAEVDALHQFAAEGALDDSEKVSGQIEEARKHAQRQRKETLNTLGNAFWHANPEIAPLRGALAVWGLTIDDVNFASFHGTSTKNNDLNETEVIQAQLKHLGRNPGNPILGIFQKSLTGHAKGGAAAWMMNGCLQVLKSGSIPGNRNADNIDSKLRNRDLIVFPNRTIEATDLKAFSISSFGFGQKGAQAIGVHPRYLFASISKDEYEDYSRRRQARCRKADSHFHRAMVLETIFVAKSSAPYDKARDVEVLLDPRPPCSK